MKHVVHKKLMETLALINELGDSEARVAFSLDLTYLHGEYAGVVKAAEECCDECFMAAATPAAIELINNLDTLKGEVDIANRNGRIGLFWWAFTRHDSEYVK